MAPYEPPAPSASEYECMSQFSIYIISRSRPGNVDRMKDHLHNLSATWVVPLLEIPLYLASGVINIIPESSPGVCGARNAALEDAFSKNLICVQLSDDPMQILWWHREDPQNISAKKRISLATAILRIYAYMLQANLYLGGGMPTARSQYSPWHSRGYSTTNFIVGDVMVIRPCELRFNEKLRLKEDYEYTIQHIKKYGGAVRVCQFMTKFKHHSKIGGCTGYRSGELEKESIQILRELHPGWWKKGRNENEIQLATPKSHMIKTATETEEGEGCEWVCPRPKVVLGLHGLEGCCGCRISVVISG